jgi:hypothetical protein
MTKIIEVTLLAKEIRGSRALISRWVLKSDPRWAVNWRLGDNTRQARQPNGHENIPLRLFAAKRIEANNPFLDA